MQKKIAVLLATYNGEKYICEQLDSILKQSYTDFVCYVHDDGSNDKTREICETYMRQNPDKICVLDYPPTGGPKQNFMSFFEHVRADYYFFCDQDDVWLPNKIEITLKEAEKITNTECGVLIFTDLKVVDQELQVMFDSFYRLKGVDPRWINYKNVLVRGYVPGCVMMVDDTVAQFARAYRHIDCLKMRDWWIMNVAYICGSKIRYVDKQLMLYRQHSNNTIGIGRHSKLSKKITNNLKKVFSGDFFKEKKAFIESPRKQAAELQYLTNPKPERLQFAMKFANLANCSKIKRMFFYLKNFKGVYHIWWMIFWV